MNASLNSTGWVSFPSKRFPGKMYYFNTVSGETSWNLPETGISSNSIPTMPPDKPYVFGNWSLSKPPQPPKSFSVNDQQKLSTHTHQCNVNTEPTLPVHNPFSVQPQVFGQASFNQTLQNVKPHLTKPDNENKRSTCENTKHFAIPSNNKIVEPIFGMVRPVSTNVCHKKLCSDRETDKKVLPKYNFQCEHEYYAGKTEITNCKIEPKVTQKAQNCCKTNFIQRIVTDDIAGSEPINQCDCSRTEYSNQNGGHIFAVPKAKIVQCITDQSCIEKKVFTENHENGDNCNCSKIESTNQYENHNFALPNAKNIHCESNEYCIEEKLFSDIHVRPKTVSHENGHNCNCSKNEFINQNGEHSFVIPKTKNNHCIKRILFTDKNDGPKVINLEHGENCNCKKIQSNQNGGHTFTLPKAKTSHCKTDQCCIERIMLSDKAVEPKPINLYHEDNQCSCKTESTNQKFPMPNTKNIYNLSDQCCMRKIKTTDQHMEQTFINPNTKNCQYNINQSFNRTDQNDGQKIEAQKPHCHCNDQSSIGISKLTSPNTSPECPASKPKNSFNTHCHGNSFTNQNIRAKFPMAPLGPKKRDIPKSKDILIAKKTAKKSIEIQRPYLYLDDDQSSILGPELSEKLVSKFTMVPPSPAYFHDDDCSIGSMGITKLNLNSVLKSRRFILPPTFNFHEISVQKTKSNIFLQCAQENNNRPLRLFLEEKSTSAEIPRPRNITNSITEHEKIKYASEKEKFDSNENKVCNTHNNFDIETQNIESPKEIDNNSSPIKENVPNNCEIVENVDNINCNDLRTYIDAKRLKSVNSTTKTSKVTKINLTQKPDKPVSKKKVTFYLGTESDVPSDTEMEANDPEQNNSNDGVWDSSQNINLTEDFATNAQTYYIVLDMDVLLQEFDILDDLLKRDPKCKLVVPYRVMSDLIELCRGESRARELVFKARCRARRLAITHDNIIVQHSPVEYGTLEHEIMYCCVNKMGENSKVMLLTNNAKLHSLAKVFDVKTCDIQTFKDIYIDNNNRSLFGEINTHKENDSTDKNGAVLTINENNDVKIVDKNNAELWKKSAFNYIKDCKRIEYNRKPSKNSKLSSERNTAKENTKKPPFHIQDVIQNDSTLVPEKESKNAKKESKFSRSRKEDENYNFETIDRNAKSSKSIFDIDQPVQRGSIFDVTKEKKNYSFEALLGRYGLDFFEDPKDDILGYKRNKNCSESENNVVINSVENFLVKTKMLEESIETRQEEFLCCFRQIVEDILASVFLKLSIQQPLDFYEALQSVITLYGRNANVKRLATNIFSTLYDRGAVKKMKILKADKVFGVVSAGLQLVQQLKILKAITMDEFRHTELSLKDLLYRIQNSTSDEEIQYLSYNTTRSDVTNDSREVKRNFVKDRSEIIRYLKKHFAEMAGYDENEVIESKLDNMSNNKDIQVVRTCGKNLSFLKLNKSNTMTMTSHDSYKTNVNNELKNYKIQKIDKISRKDDKKSQGDDRKSREVDKKTRYDKKSRDDQKPRESNKTSRDNKKSRGNKKLRDNQTDVEFKVDTVSEKIFGKIVKKDARINDKYKDLKLSFFVKNSPKGYDEKIIKKTNDASIADDVTLEIDVSSSRPQPKVIRSFEIRNISNTKPDNSDPMAKNFQLLKIFEERLRKAENPDENLSIFDENTNKSVEYDDTQSDNRSCSMSLDNCVNDSNWSSKDRNCGSIDRNPVAVHRNGIAIDRNSATINRNPASNDRNVGNGRNSVTNGRNFVGNGRNSVSNDKNIVSNDNNFVTTKWKFEIDTEYYLRNYEVKRQFVMQFYDMLKQCHKFIKHNVNKLQSSGLKQNGVFAIHDIAYSAYVRIKDVGHNLTCIIEKESTYNMSVKDTKENLIKRITYKQLLESTLECANAAENALEKLLFLTEKC